MQIIQQVKVKIATSVLKEGDQLPSVRDLASRLRINPNTVAKAYTELERSGVITTHRGMGCFVAEKSVLIRKNERVKMLLQIIERLFSEAYHLDIPLEEVEQLFIQELEIMRKGKSS